MTMAKEFLRTAAASGVLSVSATALITKGARVSVINGKADDSFWPTETWGSDAQLPLPSSAWHGATMAGVAAGTR